MTTEQTILDVSEDTMASGVSWAAIFAGASAAAALSLILLVLGVGLGFPATSPWYYQGVSATDIGISAILWLSFAQILASGVGGYLAGRLRVRWASVHSDEVYFRDTAHGLLAWAIASLATAVLLGTVVGNLLVIGASANATTVSTDTEIAGVRAPVGNPSSPSSGTDDRKHNGDSELGYWVDWLFRSVQTPTGMIEKDYGLVWREAGRIFANGLRLNGLPAEDQKYMGQVVAKQTGLSGADAEKRVINVFAKAQAELVKTEQSIKQTADDARKLAAYSSLWMVVALLSGAFVASLAATFGGKQRDSETYVDRGL